MKKVIITIALIALIGLCGFLMFWNNGKDTTSKKIRVAEVTHSIFYAPQYAAHALGYFKEEGLDVEFILTPGADKVVAAVLSGDVEIGFCGPEATVYVYNGGEKDYVATFAGLTKKDGSFIVTREKIDNFTLDYLKGKSVIGGRAGGMPEITFEWALREHGIDPKKDLKIDTSIDFAAMEGAFIGGTGDAVTLFEPNATNVEKMNKGYVVASVGELGGNVPYTAYNARKSYMEKNEDVIKSFTNAINKGLEYVAQTSSKEIAEVIAPYFPDTSISDLTKVIDRYKEIDAWRANINIEKSEFEHLQDIMVAAGQLEKRAPYEKLFETKYFK